MVNHITFQILESYKKVGFDNHDECTVEVNNLTKQEAEWLRGQVMQLINERNAKS
jgi:hypothetical protein